MYGRGCSQCSLFLFLNLFSTFESISNWFAEMICYLTVVISLIVKYEEFGDVFHLVHVAKSQVRMLISCSVAMWKMDLFLWLVSGMRLAGIH